MAHASSSSISRPRASNQFSPNRQLRRWLARELRRLRPEIAATAAHCKADHYRKHFHSFAHACLLIFHGLSGSQSLRQTYAAFATCRGLVKLSGLAPSDDPDDESLSVSYSQFAASNTSRPADFLGHLIPSLVAQVRQWGRLPGGSLPSDLHLLDSTFLRVSLLLAPWLPNNGPSDVPGVRLQVQYAPALDLPEHVLVTDTRTNDCQGLDQAILDNPERLAELEGHTLVIDLGYYSHRRFARLLAARVHFVSRLNTQASLCVEDTLPVQQTLPNVNTGRIKVLSDQRVTVGSANNRAGAVLRGLRLVTAIVEPLPKAAHQGAKPVVYRILTDRWDLDAVDVIQSYLWRWQIELFLRWLKSHVHLPRLLGYARNAVELTVWLAIIVHLLSILATHALGLARRSPALLRQLIWALAHLSSADESEPTPPAHQLAFADWEFGPAPPT